MHGGYNLASDVFCLVGLGWAMKYVLHAGAENTAVQCDHDQQGRQAAASLPD